MTQNITTSIICPLDLSCICLFANDFTFVLREIFAYIKEYRSFRESSLPEMNHENEPAETTSRHKVEHWFLSHTPYPSLVVFEYWVNLGSDIYRDLCGDWCAWMAPRTCFNWSVDMHIELLYSMCLAKPDNLVAIMGVHCVLELIFLALCLQLWSSVPPLPHGDALLWNHHIKRLKCIVSLIIDLGPKYFTLRNLIPREGDKDLYWHHCHDFY